MQGVTSSHYHAFLPGPIFAFVHVNIHTPHLKAGSTGPESVGICSRFLQYIAGCLAQGRDLMFIEGIVTITIIINPTISLFLRTDPIFFIIDYYTEI
jgi:hypothetical protein